LASVVEAAMKPARFRVEGPPATDRPWLTVVPAIGDPGAIASTLARLRCRLGEPDRICIVGPSSSIDAVRQFAPDPCLTITLRDGANDAWRSIRHAIEEDHERDVLFVAPGVDPPSLLDLRLHWSAYAHAGVAAVSPLSDLDPVSSLSRHGVPTTSFMTVDRQVAGEGWPVADAPYFVRECIYLRAAAVLRAMGSTSIANLAGLVEALREQGYVIGIAPHVFVGHDRNAPVTEPWLNGRNIPEFLAETPLHDVARRITRRTPGGDDASVEQASRPRILHISHSLGGGLERWVELFASFSERSSNFVLKSIGEKGRFGSQLWLYDARNPGVPVRTWTLRNPIAATVVHHIQYDEILDEIIEELGVEAIVVSSLIGHSLDALRANVPTIHVWHDYYPFCAAVHIYFDGVCKRCTATDVAACCQSNPLNRLFPEETPRHWMALRRAFCDIVRDQRVTQVAPSNSVVRHLAALAPDIGATTFTIIPHGIDTREAWPKEDVAKPSDPLLRLIIPGRLTIEKGGNLVSEIVRRAQGAVEVFLVGCGQEGLRFAGSHITIIENYDRASLPRLLHDIAPDVALLLSVVPETFSFVLDEMNMAGIPAIATRTGSFVDRISDGATGFLCEPSVDSLVERILMLAGDRSPLDSVRRNLSSPCRRGAGEMVAAYEKVLRIPAYSPRAYFAGMWRGALRQVDISGMLPAGSPAGFADFLNHVERGTHYHVRQTRRLREWQRRILEAGSRSVFGAVRALMRLLR